MIDRENVRNQDENRSQNLENVRFAKAVAELSGGSASLEDPNHSQQHAW